MNHASDQADIDGVAIAVAESCVVCTREEIEQLMPVVPWMRGTEASSDTMLHIVELLTAMGKVEVVRHELLCG